MPLPLEIIITVIWSVFIWRVSIMTWWPYDWKGSRKSITLTSRKNDWEDDDE